MSMPRRISSTWAFLVGFIVVPFASALNGLVEFHSVTALSHRSPPVPDLGLCFFFALLFSTPLALITSFLICCWNEGYYVATRIFCGLMTCVCVVVGRAGSVLLASDEDRELNRFLCSILLLPLVWTLLFPVFALCARQPKRSA